MDQNKIIKENTKRKKRRYSNIKGTSQQEKTPETIRIEEPKEIIKEIIVKIKKCLYNKNVIYIKLNRIAQDNNNVNNSVHQGIII